MNSFFDIQKARSDLYERALPCRSYLDFIRQNGIDLNATADFAGALVVTRILAFDRALFDFAEDGQPEAFEAVVCEALGADGETVDDLVAWPLDRPRCVLSMYRRAPLLGLWEAMSPYSYSFGSPLVLHRSPLDWLRSGCRGAAIVVPELAARTLLDLPGKFAAQDWEHAREIEQLIASLSRNRMVVRKARAA